MLNCVKIEGLSRGEVLVALYEAATAVAPMWLRSRGPERPALTVAEAETLCAGKGDVALIDYLHGRPIKVELRRGARDFDAVLYDRDHGEGAAQRAVDALRKKKAA